MIPTAFVILAALPQTPNGKIDTLALPAPERAQTSLETDEIPFDALTCQLASIWEETLQIAPIGLHTNFFDLGGHSLLAVRLFARIEQRLGHKLPLALLFQAPTIAAQARYLREHASAAPWSALIPIRSRGSRPPLYCVHALGGNVLTYRALVQALDAEQPVYGLQSLGMVGDGLPFCSVEEMATHYLAEIRRLQPEGPYHLCGMSYGGVVAFEMARQLQAAGQRTALLAIFDSTPPGYRSPGRWKRLSGHWQYFQSLDRAERGEFLRHQVRNLWAGRNRSRPRSAAVPAPAAEETLPGGAAQVARLHRHTWQAYAPPQGDYAGSLLLFRADRQPAFYFDSRTVGWENYVQGPLDIHVVSGTHTGIMEEPHVQELARELQRALHKAGAHA